MEKEDLKTILIDIAERAQHECDVGSPNGIGAHREVNARQLG